MRGIACLFALSVVCVACGKVPVATGDGGIDDSGTPDASRCTGNALSCGADDALYQCDETSGATVKVQDCQHGCATDHCKACAANTTFCSGDDLVMCSAAGEITNPMTCANGCQMDRCNTCDPGVAYCNGSTAITCGTDGTPSSMMNCSSGCVGGVCNACQPNTTSCNGDTLVVCNANGTVASTTSCALGCTTTPNTHCKALVPSFGVPAPSGTLPDLVVDQYASLNITNCGATPNSVDLQIGTTSMSIVGSPQIARVGQAAGPPICIVRFNKITIMAGTTLVINDGGGGHVLSLQGTDDIQIAGTIAYTYGGAGPAPGESVQGTSFNNKYVSGGGGGAGGVRAGGTGGTCLGCPSNLPGGTGGAAVPTFSTALTPGSHGGAIMNGMFVYGPGGSGGGALQLVSNTRVTVASTGRLDLNGKGAIGDIHVRSLGAGGGSGGSIVIEAPAVSFSANAIAAANGGGGAGGCPVCVGDFIPTCTNADGENGQMSATRAAGGNCNGPGNGGFEASGPTNPPANGANSDTGAATASAGGGGGSSGIIVLKARAAANVSLAGGSVVSPQPTIGAVGAN